VDGGQVTGVGYNPSGLVLCNNEVVRDGSHPSFTKLMEVTHGFPCSFLLHDATQSAVVPQQHNIHLPICLCYWGIISWSCTLDHFGNNFLADYSGVFTVCTPKHHGSTPRETT